MTEEEQGYIEQMEYFVQPEEIGRLDVFSAQKSGLSRSALQRMIEEGQVTVNGAAATAKTKLKPGDAVKICPLPPSNAEILPEDIPLDIVYEDGYIAVINKPQGMVVHPAPGNYSGTLVNALMFRLTDLSGVGGQLRPGIVHRIDKLTSGLIVVAKNDEAHNSLAAQFKAHSAHRLYVALVLGNLKEDEGTVNAPIGRHRTDRKRMAVTSTGEGREAVTNWRVLHRFGEYTLILARLETGRTHQIRVHMAHIKHPVAGDEVYGPKTKLQLSGQALHAARLALEHPHTKEHMVFSAPLPGWYLNVLRRLDGETDFEVLIQQALDEML